MGVPNRKLGIHRHSSSKAAGQQRGIVEQLLPQVPVRHQRPHRRAELRGRGLEPAEEQRHVQADELVLGQLVVVVAGVHEHAEQVVGLVRPPIGDQTRARTRPGCARSVPVLHLAVRGPVISSTQPRNIGMSASRTPRIPESTVSGTFHASRRHEVGRAARRFECRRGTRSTFSVTPSRMVRIFGAANATKASRRIRVCRGGSMLAMMSGSSMRPSHIRGRVPPDADLLAEAAVAVDGLDVVVAGREPARLAEGQLDPDRPLLLEVPVEVVDGQVVGPDDRIRDDVVRISRHPAPPSSTTGRSPVRRAELYARSARGLDQREHVDRTERLRPDLHAERRQRIGDRVDHGRR